MAVDRDNGTAITKQNIIQLIVRQPYLLPCSAPIDRRSGAVTAGRFLESPELSFRCQALNPGEFFPLNDFLSVKVQLGPLFCGIFHKNTGSREPDALSDHGILLPQDMMGVPAVYGCRITFQPICFGGIKSPGVGKFDCQHLICRQFSMLFSVPAVVHDRLFKTEINVIFSSRARRQKEALPVIQIKIQRLLFGIRHHHSVGQFFREKEPPQVDGTNLVCRIPANFQTVFGANQPVCRREAECNQQKQGSQECFHFFSPGRR